mgnify:CR=1 FL=1
MLKERITMTQTVDADVVTIGESMILFQPMTDGPLSSSHLFMKSVAGAESNVAIGLVRMKKKVRWISRVGSDPFGHMILSTLAGEGIDVSHVIKDEEAPTGIYFKEFKGYGDPNVYYYRKFSAFSRFSPEDVRPEWFDGARHLHVTGITPALGPKTAEFIREVMKLARQKGLSISYDPNLRRKLWSEERAKEVLSSLVPLCDIFLPGIEEAQFLAGSLDVSDLGKKLLEMGAKLVVIKLGEKGSIGFFSNHTVTAPPFPVDRIVDTVGAGDAFAAGLLSALLDEECPLDEHVLQQSLSKALRRANVLGALATQFKGDWEGIPFLDEVEHLMQGKETIKR